jgi:hypothetical protein
VFDNAIGVKPKIWIVIPNYFDHYIARAYRLEIMIRMKFNEISYVKRNSSAEN